MQEFIQDIHQILVGINTTATIEEKISELRENDWKDYVIQFESNADSCKLNYGSEIILSVLITGIQIALHQTKDAQDEKHLTLFQALRRYISTSGEVELFFKRGGCEVIIEAFDTYRRNFLFAAIILEIIEKISINELNQNKLYELGLSPLLLSLAELSLPVEMIAKICEVCIPLSKNTAFLNDILHSTLITTIIKPLRLADDPNDYPAVRSSLQLVAVLCDTQSGRQILYRDHEITDRFIHCLKEYFMQGDIVYLTVLAMQSAHFDKDIFQSFRCSDVFSGLFAGLKVQWKHLDLSVQAARLEFHEHDGCALLCKVLSKSITQPEILVIVVDTIHHLAVHPTIISTFGSRNCCKHLVHAIRHNKTDEECLLHLLPAIKRLAEDNANKIRFDNCQATKECIDIFTYWVSIQEKKENDIATEIQKELDEMSREKDISASAIKKRLKREKLRLPIILALIETLIPLTEELLYENNPQILYPKIPRATLDQFMKITSFYLMKEDITLMHPLAKVMINITKQLDGEFPHSIYTEIYNGMKMYCAIGNIRQKEFNISILMMKNYFYMINNLSRKTKRAEVFGDIGCCELLVVLLRLFTELNQASPSVITNMQQKDRNLFVYELCHTIHQLTNKSNNQNKRVFRHAGACDILIALLNKIPFDSNHGHSTFTVLHACIECISNLAEDKINRKIFSTAIKQLCDVLREYVERREIVGATILALQRITYQNENNQKTLGIHKGPESLIRALFLYLHDKVMIESIVKMIFPLSETCEENRAFFGEGGACEALYEVILQYNDDEYLKTIALDAMSILSTNETNFRRLTTIGAMNLVNNNKGIINAVTTTVASTIHGIFEKQISQGSTTSGASGASRSSKDSK
eukprot:gene10238-11136_t